MSQRIERLRSRRGGEILDGKVRYPKDVTALDLFGVKDVDAWIVSMIAADWWSRSLSSFVAMREGLPPLSVIRSTIEQLCPGKTRCERDRLSRLVQAEVFPLREAVRRKVTEELVDDRGDRQQRASLLDALYLPIGVAVAGLGIRPRTLQRAARAGLCVVEGGHIWGWRARELSRFIDQHLAMSS